jgi:hypothetical protein
MESANKAILMAAGMLFAIMVISLVAFVFSRITTIPTAEDTQELIEQSAAFNNEYTAYDKKIMYGVDVISVLNKAKSNNDKYVLEKFVTGGGYNTDYIIDIQVTLKTTLEESMVVSYVAQTANSVTERDYIGTQAGPYKEALTDYYLAGGQYNGKNLFTAPSSSYQTSIYGSANKWSTLKFMTQTFETNVTAGTYHLLGTDGGTEPQPGSYTNAMLEADNTLKQLLTYSTEMSQTIKNRSGNTFSPYGWSEATWKPATYDLKTRKFKCIGDETVYSEKTGRIIKMVFVEI